MDFNRLLELICDGHVINLLPTLLCYENEAKSYTSNLHHDRPSILWLKNTFLPFGWRYSISTKMVLIFRWPNCRKKSQIDDSSQSGTSAPSLPMQTAISAPQSNFAASSAQSTQQPLIAPSGLTQSENNNDTAGSLSAIKGLSYYWISQDLFPKKQIYSLRVLHEPPEPLADIIFVHGLIGNLYDIWLEKELGIYWPVQLAKMSWMYEFWHLDMMQMLQSS